VVKADPAYPWAFHFGVIASFLPCKREHGNPVNIACGAIAGETWKCKVSLYCDNFYKP